jgi:hypothetical protein
MYICPIFKYSIHSNSPPIIMHVSTCQLFLHWGMQIYMRSVRKMLIPHPQKVFREDTAPAPRKVLGE